MRVVSRTVGFASAVAALSLGLFTLAAVAQQQHPAGAHNHPDAAKMKNPVAASPASIAAGKKLYDAQCASCHGTSGKGDGKAGALLKPLPSDLTDATGSTARRTVKFSPSSGMAPSRRACAPMAAAFRPTTYGT